MKSFHHAYVIEGERDESLSRLFSFLEKEMVFERHGNPDFWHASFETFGIEEGRQIKEMQEKKSFTPNGRKVFVISLNFITREAQNSLLKVFEEPTEGTHFFLIVPSAEIFLPTVRSRVATLSFDDFEKAGVARSTKSIRSSTGIAEKFISSTPAARLSLLADILEEKDKVRAIDFLNNLEKELYGVWGTDLDAQKSAIFKQIIKCRDYLGDRAPSVKMILEHIALVTPVVVR